MRELVQSNYAVILTTVFLIVFILTSGSFDKKTNRLFLGAAICVALFVAAQFLKSIVKMSDGPVFLRILFSVIAYITPPATAYIVDLLLIRNTRRIRQWLLAIPLLLCVLIESSAFFCGLSFYYSPEKVFVRGPLGYTPFVISAFYLVFLLAFTIRNLTRGHISESLITMMIMLSSVMATVLESGFHYEYLLSTSCAVSLTFFYMFFHINQNNRDQLTRALTRRRFYLDAEKRIGMLTAVLSLDLNDLKQYNDRFGHAAGDAALVTLANTVQSCLPRTARLYRTGGDEFMVLCFGGDSEKTEALVGSIRAAMAGTPYVCAIGSAMCAPATGLDTACRIADKAMYEDKARLKAAAHPANA